MDVLRNIFEFSQESPLIFTRLYFWVFFAIVLALYTVIYKYRASRSAYLFAVSLFFYYKTSGIFFLLLIFSTFVDYFIGYAIYTTHEKWAKKVFVGMSILVNIGVLSYYKYAYYFVTLINGYFHTNFEVVDYIAEWTNLFAGTHFDTSIILLPVGISFFTFQTISYSLDVYLGKLKPVRNILDFGFYVSYFPQLVAGPIVRASEFIPQIYDDYKLTKREFGYAIFCILNGLIKKMVIGDYLAVNFIDRVFENPSMFTGFENLMGLYGYSLQVYCDFSGYTDIAIGVALLMGFRLPANFNSPYKAVSTADFWRRWHMSLSRWLKDYLYIPLGGNRNASFFTYLSVPLILGVMIMHNGWNWLYFGFFFVAIVFWYLYIKKKKNYWAFISMYFLVFLGFLIGPSNWVALGFMLAIVIVWLLEMYVPGATKYIITDANLMLTMLIGGLWHGPGTKWVIWGGLNGLGLVVYKLWCKVSPYEDNKSWPVRFWKILLTFNFITFTRFFFRGADMPRIGQMMKQIGTNFEAGLIPQMTKSYWLIFTIMAIGYIIHWLPTKWKDWYKQVFIQTPMWVKGVVCVLAVILIYQARTSDLQPFIYFQF